MGTKPEARFAFIQERAEFRWMFSRNAPREHGLPDQVRQ
jgi:hypothetical protein